jgi:hypothetical protein
MRSFVCVVFLLAFPAHAQEPSQKLSREEFPILEQSCAKRQMRWAGKPDWQARCKLAVWREIEVTDSNGKTHKQKDGHVLFEYDLILPRPASYDECEKRVKRWMFKDAPEILRNVGWLVDGKKKS